jgi:hypothetical protein
MSFYNNSERKFYIDKSLLRPGILPFGVSIDLEKLNKDGWDLDDTIRGREFESRVHALMFEEMRGLPRTDPVSIVHVNQAGETMAPVDLILRRRFKVDNKLGKWQNSIYFELKSSVGRWNQFICLSHNEALQLYHNPNMMYIKGNFAYSPRTKKIVCDSVQVFFWGSATQDLKDPSDRILLRFLDQYNLGLQNAIDLSII